MARPRIRGSQEYLVFSSFTSLGWRVLRQTSYEAGEAMVLRGKFRRVIDSVTSRHIGYQPIEASPQAKQPSDASRAALVAAHARANAGLMGRSRTAHLSEEQRKTRIHPKSGRLLPEEDFVEQTAKLMRTYPFSANFADIRLKRRGLAPGGDRAVRVYPPAPVEAGA